MITTHPLELAAELLLHIMEYLPKGAAAAAAITCQAWKDPALDILWRKINLEHLLSVLAPLKVEEDKLHFTRTPARETWARFQLLAPRVHWTWLNVVLHGSLVVELNVGNPHSFPLLPSLSYLSILPHQVVLLLVGPRLRVLHLHMGHVGILIPGRLFGRIADISPIITELDFEFEVNVFRTKTIVNMLQRLPSLLRLALHLDGSRDLQPIGTALAGLPNLESLELKIRDGTAIFDGTPALSVAFPSLRYLIVRARFAADLPRLLESMSPHSQLLDLEYGEDKGVDMMIGDRRQICLRAGQQQRLQTFRLIGHYDDSLSLSSDILSPVYALSDLSVMIPGFAEWVNLTDDDVYDLASALPHLETLELHTNNETLGTSLRAYQTIVTLCPAIVTLALPIDATKPTPQEVIQASITLSFIDVQESPISDPRAVALLLARLSDAKSFELMDQALDDDRSRKWEEVMVTMPALRKARMRRREQIES